MLSPSASCRFRLCFLSVAPEMQNQGSEPDSESAHLHASPSPDSVTFWSGRPFPMQDKKPPTGRQSWGRMSPRKSQRLPAASAVLEPHSLGACDHQERSSETRVSLEAFQMQDLRRQPTFSLVPSGSVQRPMDKCPRSSCDLQDKYSEWGRGAHSPHSHLPFA